jgi:DNA-binding response OmpR family regulator
LTALAPTTSSSNRRNEKSVYHILLIDDNSFFSATFAGLLQRAGYRVSLAPDNREGKGLHRRDPAHLVIMSIYLEEGNGQAYLEDLRETFATTPVIALLRESAKGELFYPLLLKELGNRRVFFKPFRTEEVLDAIYEELAPPAREAGW